MKQSQSIDKNINNKKSIKFYETANIQPGNNKNLKKSSDNGIKNLIIQMII